MDRVKGIEPSFLVGVFAFPKGDRSPKCILRHLFAVVLVSPPLESRVHRDLHGGDGSITARLGFLDGQENILDAVMLGG